jgi:alkylation response protein AidB-like acyl-CoA dehydrogenase
MTRWRHLDDAAFGEEVRAFSAEHVAPRAADIDTQDIYPSEVIAEAARRGYNAMTLPVEYGGRGAAMREALVVFEELSVASAAVGISMITIYQAQTIIAHYGDESLRRRMLPRFAEGLRAAYALTEQSRGSDIRSLETRARRVGDGWVLTGEKSFITSGSEAELYIVLAETDVGVSVFAVSRETDGVSTYEGTNAQTFGLRNGPHVNLVLDEVQLPADALVGPEGRGVKCAVVTLAHSRTLAAGVSLGIARAAIDGALEFAVGREAFDQRVIDFQGIQWYFAETVAQIDAARLLTYQAAGDLDAGRDIARSSSEAKLLASRVATEAASMAVQVCGARGTMESAPFGRYLRDAKAYEVAGGSSEILKNTIAKSLIKEFGADPES